MKVVAALVGAWVGLLGAVVHGHVAHVAGLSVPWGIVLAAVAAGSGVAAAGRLVRRGGALFLLGWALVVTAVQVWPTQGYLVGSDALGWGFIASCVGSMALVLWRSPYS